MFLPMTGSFPWNQLELIDAVIDRNHVKNLYNPEFADNMKELVRAGPSGISGST